MTSSNAAYDYICDEAYDRCAQMLERMSKAIHNSEHGDERGELIAKIRAETYENAAQLVRMVKSGESEEPTK